MAEESFVTESRSSVKIGQTAKGEPVVEVKVYEGFDQAALDAMRVAAVETFQKTVAAVGA